MSVDEASEGIDLPSSRNGFLLDSDTFDSSDLYERTSSGREPETRDGDSADEVDPSKLVRSVSIDEIRWYYRNGALAKTIVDKPLEDSFKHGWSIANDPTNSVENALESVNFEEKYKLAQKKARRDGWCILYAITEDSASVSESPKDVRGIRKLRPLSIDHFDKTLSRNFADDLPDGYDQTDVRISEHGLVISQKISDEEHFGELLGALYESDVADDHRTDIQFIHRDRFFLYTYNEAVDGDLADDAVFGEYEGDSELQNVIHLIKALHKGNWASMQTLFRHSAPLHVLKPPDGVSPDEWDQANNEMKNINSKSSFTLPPSSTAGDWELEAVGNGETIETSDKFDAIFSQICAGTEMTKSVLFGTQSGTVSGSETDIKNYFNQVNRLREGRVEDDIEEVVRRFNSWDKSLIPNIALGYDVNWEPLFKIDHLDQSEMVRTEIQALSNAVNDYLLTPDEAREILDERWARLDTDIDLDDLTEEQLDYIDRVTVFKNKNFPEGAGEENEMEGKPRNPRVGQNGGGAGGTGGANGNPTR
jgi:hypothetical protein